MSFGLNLDEKAWSQPKDDIFFLCTSRKVPSCCNCHTLKLLSLEQATKFFPSCENDMCITEKLEICYKVLKRVWNTGMPSSVWMEIDCKSWRGTRSCILSYSDIHEILGSTGAHDVIELNPIWPELTCYQDFEVNALGLADLCSPGVSKGGCPSIPYARTCM